MARPIVTPQLVAEAAEALLAEKVDPTILTVQARIGAGSYSTVKKHLDLWKEQRAKSAAAAPETPAEVEAKARDLARAVWLLAAAEAKREAQQAKDQAAAEVAAAQDELRQALTEITRLEASEAKLTATVEQQQARLREVELALAEAQTQARRVVEAERELSDARAQLEQVRGDVTLKAVEAGKLSGEVEALRRQVTELMAAIRPPAKPSKGGM